MAKGESKTSPRRISAKERQAQALALRKAGISYPQIATTLGYRSPQSAWAAVDRALKKMVQEPAEELLSMELDRLDELWIEMYRQAKQGIMGAVDRCLRIMERRAKLLGLDAPEKLSLDWRREAEDAGLEPSEIFEEMVGLFMGKTNGADG